MKNNPKRVKGTLPITKNMTVIFIITANIANTQIISTIFHIL